MIAYRDQKINNAICYLASEHIKRAKKPAYQTYIYKYLALFDFATLQKTGKPAIDIEYDAMDKGPVPRHLYDQRTDLKTACYKFVSEGENSIKIVPLKKPDLDYFSQIEIEIMNSILDEFAHPWTTTEDLILATHERICAWGKAWRRRGERLRVPMSYDDAFEGLGNKSDSELNPEEENYLVFKGLKAVSE